MSDDKIIGELMATCDRLKARIAELEARPDPPTPVLSVCRWCAELRDRPCPSLDCPWVKTAVQADPPAPAAIDEVGAGNPPSLFEVVSRQSPSGHDDREFGMGAILPDDPAAIDPDMPRRFRYRINPCGNVKILYRMWHLGCYFPGSNSWRGESGSHGVGYPKIIADIEWIDPAPAEKGSRDDSRQSQENSDSGLTVP